MSQEDLFQNPLESSPQDIRVSPSQPQGKGEAKKTLATSSRTSLELLHKQDQLLPFSRMFMDTSLWAWTTYSMRWKPKATPQGRLLFQLAVSAPVTSATESGLSPEMWATPRTTDVTGGPRQLDEKGRRVSKSNPKLKFGANLADQVKMWPTPRASEYKDTGPVGSKSHTHMKDRKYLCAAVKETAQPSGKLNPAWTEWLMGYPIGWTELKD